MRPEPETLLKWLKPEPNSRELECEESLQPGDYEIYSAKLEQILLEGREVFIRMGVSSMIRGGDLAVALYTQSGDMAATSCGTFLHVLSSQLPVKFIIKNWLSEPTVGVKEGDVFYFNEALYGGVHNPDQMAMMPIFSGGELIAWASAVSHQPETGAIEPGGMPVTAKTRYAEGMRLTPIKIGENYQLRADLMEMCANFVRAPRMQDLDMRARVTACDRLRVRIQELVQSKGNDLLIGLLRRMIMVAEEGAREKIRGWNDGIYRAVVFGDALGMQEEALHRFCLTLRKEEDRLIFDFGGTSPEHGIGSYHATAASLPGHAAVVLYNFPLHDLPVSCGALAPMEWIVPRGTLLNPDPDAAIANAPVIGTILMGAIYLCVDKMIFDSPERECIVAPTASGCGMMVSGVNQYGARFGDLLTYPLNTLGQGARVDMDGENCYGFVFTPHARGPDLDETEGTRPFVHLFQKHLKDSCGFGKYRSGVGAISVYAVRGMPQLAYTMTAKETRIHGSPGLFGGYPANAKFGLEIRNSDIWQKMERGDKDIPSEYRELLEKKAIKGEYRFEPNIRPARIVNEGDIWVCMQGGTGGYGDVLERDPELVTKDVGEEIISHWTAQNIYKVVYDAETLEVDFQKTEERRQKEREERIKRGKPFQEFQQEWLKKRPPEAALGHYGSWPDAKKVREIVRM
jgi:N-methylhydantoinase B/oxoprolinase/acetone carboxylase alpha subunit